MKTNLKLIYVLTLSLMFNFLSCNNDDDQVIITLQDLETTIDENPTNGEVISAIESNATGNLTFSITSQMPAGAISINSTGELVVADASLFDFETNPTITAVVSATEAQNTAMVTITVNNVNELTVQDFTTTIDENPTNGDSLGTVQATGDSALSYSISSQTPIGALGIDANTGELTVADAALFDFETNPTVTANISVDNSGNVETLSVTIDLTDLHEVGEFKFGGVIFWIDPTSSNSSGMVCDINNQGVSSWSCSNYVDTGATGTVIGTGASNTMAIISNSCTSGSGAANLIAALDLNGYDDWFLPSKDELIQIYLNRDVIDATSAANGGSDLENPASPLTLWSSSQSASDYTKAWGLQFVNNWQGDITKTVILTSRAVRAWTDF